MYASTKSINKNLGLSWEDLLGALFLAASALLELLVYKVTKFTPSNSLWLYLDSFTAFMAFNEAV